MSSPPLRYRIGFGKHGSLRWIGHLDLQRCWERTFRRAGLPLRYSAGFHPHPRMVFGAALPLGFTSEAELVDAYFDEPQSVPLMLAQLRAAAQPGFSMDRITLVPHPSPSVPSLVHASVYRVTPPDGTGLAQGVERVLAAETLPRTRRKKAYDLKTLMDQLSFDPDSGVLQMQLACREGATGRPEEVLDELGLDHRDCQIHRLELLLSAPAAQKPAAQQPSTQSPDSVVEVEEVEAEVVAAD